MLFRETELLVCLHILHILHIVCRLLYKRCGLCSLYTGNASIQLAGFACTCAVHEAGVALRTSKCTKLIAAHGSGMSWMVP